MFWELEAAQVRVLGVGGPYREQKALLKFWAMGITTEASAS